MLWSDINCVSILKIIHLKKMYTREGFMQAIQFQCMLQLITKVKYIHTKF